MGPRLGLLNAYATAILNFHIRKKNTQLKGLRKGFQKVSSRIDTPSNNHYCF